MGAHRGRGLAYDAIHDLGGVSVATYTQGCSWPVEMVRQRRLPGLRAILRDAPVAIPPLAGSVRRSSPAQMT